MRNKKIIYNILRMILISLFILNFTLKLGFCIQASSGGASQGGHAQIGGDGPAGPPDPPPDPDPLPDVIPDPAPWNPIGEVVTLSNTDAKVPVMDAKNEPDAGGVKKNMEPEDSGGLKNPNISLESGKYLVHPIELKEQRLKY